MNITKALATSSHAVSPFCEAPVTLSSNCFWVTGAEGSSARARSTLPNRMAAMTRTSNRDLKDRPPNSDDQPHAHPTRGEDRLERSIPPKAIRLPKEILTGQSSQTLLWIWIALAIA